MEVWLQLLVNGISIGAVYALFALGYTLVFSVLGVINFAHGAVFTCGAYFTYIFLGGVVGSNGLLATQKLPVTFPLAIAQRGYVLEAGELVLQGNASDLYQNENLRRSYLGDKL